MVENGAFGHEINYVTIVKKILNLEGHLYHTTGSRVEWSFIGGGSAIKRATLSSFFMF